ncbi:MAG: molybdate ABC transporter substrate-binding protein [Proteobacteria bacterium]|nr:molybdate ABC transporter substrate-binding protein [Pseudomonadota bacterium]
MAVASVVAMVTVQAEAREATEVKVAVAANFTAPSKDIGVLFEKATGNKLVLSFGATGQFYTQITQGAPFDILISADTATPAKAIASGYAVQGTSFTYAVGKLVLFGKAADAVKGEATLKDGKFQKIAIASPELAPYGAAAVETMKALGVYDALAPKIVKGNNIAQTFQFVDTGNAEVGFVALSQVIKLQGGSRWAVPQNLYKPIAQDAVLLKPGADNEGAKAFLGFLKSEEARTVIERYGYGIPE